MRGLARRAFADHWIDAGPRPGKVGGGYCMWLLGDESRILVNYSPAYDGVTTLAHEFGHAYHNLNEAGLTPLQRRTPTILAETASTFCETLVKEAALVDAEPGERTTSWSSQLRALARWLSISQPVRFRAGLVRWPSRAGAVDRRAESFDAGRARGNLWRRAGQG